MVTSKLTSTSQTTISQPIRTALNLHKGDALLYEPDDFSPVAYADSAASNSSSRLASAKPVLTSTLSTRSTRFRSRLAGIGVAPFRRDDETALLTFWHFGDKRWPIGLGAHVL
jgi:hypothetical protein